MKQTRQFTATVQNTTNTAVIWKVNGIAGGNSTVGTISTSGVYKAPNSVPRPGGCDGQRNVCRGSDEDRDGVRHGLQALTPFRGYGR